MPLNSPTRELDAPSGGGVLYVIATPIGNKDDITLRALKVLKQVDCIAAEDTRHTGRFLTHHGITTRLVSYHEHNERTKTPALIQRLADGGTIALVSDAGTPAVSDPGYRLVSAAVVHGIRVVPVPGVSAAITALSASGLPTDSFVFVGFPAKKKGKRKKQLQQLADSTRTLIFYESPKRITGFLSEIIRELGDRPAVLCREMTKLHEEFLRGSVAEIRESLVGRPAVKGECTLLIAGHDENSNLSMSPDSDQIIDEIKTALAAGDRLSAVSRAIAGKFGISKRDAYETALKLKKENSL